MLLRTSASAIALAIAVALSTSPASGQITQEGLVNVAIDDATVQVPVAIAANVCGVAVNVLAQDLADGDAVCESTGTAVARNRGGNGGPVTQRGLVNVAVTDLVVQVPVGIAANVCDVAVNLLTSGIQTGDVECNAEGVSHAFR